MNKYFPYNSFEEIKKDTREYYKYNFLKQFVFIYLNFFSDCFESWFSGGDVFYMARIQEFGLFGYCRRRFGTLNEDCLDGNK